MPANIVQLLNPKTGRYIKIDRSKGEVITGDYTISDNENSNGQKALSILIKTDNGLIECNGLTRDQSNLSTTVYAVFESNTSMRWYINQTDPLSETILLSKK